MKRYILFSKEELSDLGKGVVIDHLVPNGEKVSFMCAECYEEMLNETEEE